LEERHLPGDGIARLGWLWHGKRETLPLAARRCEPPGAPDERERRWRKRCDRRVARLEPVRTATLPQPSPARPLGVCTFRGAFRAEGPAGSRSTHAAITRAGSHTRQGPADDRAASPRRRWSCAHLVHGPPVDAPVRARRRESSAGAERHLHAPAARPSQPLAHGTGNGEQPAVGTSLPDAEEHGIVGARAAVGCPRRAGRGAEHDVEPPRPGEVEPAGRRAAGAGNRSHRGRREECSAEQAEARRIRGSRDLHRASRISNRRCRVQSTPGM
jgi:hypothetical protein